MSLLSDKWFAGRSKFLGREDPPPQPAVTGDRLSPEVILASMIRTAAQGGRVEIDQDGIRAYNADGGLVFNVKAKAGTVTVRGSIQTNFPGVTPRIDIGGHGPDGSLFGNQIQFYTGLDFPGRIEVTGANQRRIKISSPGNTGDQVGMFELWSDPVTAYLKPSAEVRVLGWPISTNRALHYMNRGGNPTGEPGVVKVYGFLNNLGKMELRALGPTGDPVTLYTEP